MQIIILALALFSIVGCRSELQNGTHSEKIGDYKLNYSILGSGSEVMIVGHPNSGKIGYEVTLKPLEEKFKMVYYEPRGTGESEAPASVDEYSQDHSVQEIEDLRESLGVDKIWLFGHSDQSAIALVYALKFPQHTKGVILSGTSLIGSQEESFQRRRESEARRAEESEWFSKVIQDWEFMIENNTKFDKEGNDISDAPIKWWCYNEESSHQVIKVAHQIAEHGRRRPVGNKAYTETKEEREKYLQYQDEFKEIDAQILIINGKYDTNNPPEFAEQLQERLPNSTLVIINEAAHFPWVENSDDFFAEVYRWLEEFE